MAIVVVCPSCGHRAGAKEEWVGRQVKCPGCGDKITVQSAESAATAAARRPSEPAPRPLSQQRPTPQQRTTPQHRASSQQRSPSAPRAATPAVPGRQAQPKSPPSQPPDPRGGEMADLFGANLSAGDPLGAAPAVVPLGMPPASMTRKKAGSAKTVWIVLGAVGGVVVLGCAGLFAVGVASGVRAARQRASELSGAAASTANLPAFSPDNSLVGQLGAEASFDRYSLRLPNGYAAMQLPLSKPPPAGVRITNWAWADSPASDGTRHVITAVLAEMPNGRHSNNLDAEVKAYIEGARAEVGGATFVPGATTKGRLFGQPFARASYTVAAPQVTLHSITYLGFDGQSRMVSVIGACKEAEGSEVYKMLETSLLTLNRK